MKDSLRNKIIQLLTATIGNDFLRQKNVEERL